jgi:hypothetical protein
MPKLKGGKRSKKGSYRVVACKSRTADGCLKEFTYVPGVGSSRETCFVCKNPKGDPYWKTYTFKTPAFEGQEE